MRACDGGSRPISAPKAAAFFSITRKIAGDILTGRAPVSSPLDLPGRLREGNGLLLSGAMNGAGRWLKEMVRASTAPVAGSGAYRLVLFDFSLSRAPVETITAGTRPYLEPFLPDRRPPRWDLHAERYAAAFRLTAGPPRSWRRGSVGIPGTSLAVRPGIFPRAKSLRYPHRHGHTTAISRTANDPRQHAPYGVRLLDVSCSQCHHRAILIADMLARSRAGEEAAAPLFKHSARLVT
jgi:hypothetical protein